MAVERQGPGAPVFPKLQRLAGRPRNKVSESFAMAKTLYDKIFDGFPNFCFKFFPCFLSKFNDEQGTGFPNQEKPVGLLGMIGFRAIQDDMIH